MLSATLRPSAISSDLQSLVFKSEKLDAAIAKYEEELESTIRLKEVEASASSDRYTAAFKGAQQQLKETKRAIEGHLAVLGPEVTRSLLSAVDSSHSSCEELRAAGERHAAATKSIAYGKDKLIGVQKELLTHLKERCRGAEVELKTSILASRHLSDVLFSVRRYVLNVMTERAEWQQHHGLNPNDMMPEATASASDTFLGTCEKLLDALRKSEEPRLLGATRAAAQKRQARSIGTFSSENQLAQSVRNTNSAANNLLALSLSSSPEPAILLDATGTFGGGTTNRSFSSFPFPPPPAAPREERSPGKSVTAPSAPFPQLSPSAHLPLITSPTPQHGVSIEVSPQQQPLALRKSVSSARFHHYLPSLAPDTDSSNLRVTLFQPNSPTTTAASFSHKRLGSVSPQRAHSSRMLSTANASTVNESCSSPTSLLPPPQHNQRQTTIGFARSPSLSMLQHRSLGLVGAGGGGGGSADEGAAALLTPNNINSFSDFAAGTNKLIGQIRDAKRGQLTDASSKGGVGGAGAGGAGGGGGGGGVTSPITFVPPPIQPQCANAPRQGADTADSVALSFIQRAQMIRVADKEQEIAMAQLLGGGGNGASSFSRLSSVTDNRTGAYDGTNLDVVRCGERSWRVRGGDGARWVKPKEELALLKLVLSSTAISSGDDVSSLLDALAAAHQEKEEMKSAIADTLGLRCRHMKDSLAKLRSDVVSFSTLHLPHMVSTLEKAVGQWVEQKAPSFFDAVHRSVTEAAVRDALEAQRAEILMNSTANGGGRNRNRLSVSGNDQRRLSTGSKGRVLSSAAKGVGIGGLDLEGGGASSGESSQSQSNGRQRDTSMGNLFYSMNVGMEGGRGGGGGDSPNSLSLNSHGAQRSFASSYLTITSNAARGRAAVGEESAHTKRSKGTPSRGKKRGAGGETPLSTQLSPTERGNGMVRSPARSPGGRGTIGAAREKFLEQQRWKQVQTIKQQERLIGLQQQQISLLREQLDAAKGLALRQRKRQFHPPAVLTRKDPLKKDDTHFGKEESPTEIGPADVAQTKEDLLTEASHQIKEREISDHTAEEIHVQTHVNHNTREATEVNTNESLLQVDRAPNIEEGEEEEAHPRTLEGASTENGDGRNTQPIPIEIKSDLFAADDTKSKADIAQLGSVIRNLFETLSTHERGGAEDITEEADRLKLSMEVTSLGKSSSSSTKEEQFIRQETAGGIRLVVDGVSYLICIEETSTQEDEIGEVKQNTNGRHHSGCGEASGTAPARADADQQTRQTTSMSNHLRQQEKTPPPSSSVARGLVDLFEENSVNTNINISYLTSPEGNRSAVVVRQGLNGRHDNGGNFAQHGLKRASATNRTSSLATRRPWSRPFYTIIVGSGGELIPSISEGAKYIPSLSAKCVNIPSTAAMHPPPNEEGTEVDDDYIMNSQRELDEKIAAALEMTERLTNASKQFLTTYADMDDSSCLTAFSPSPPRHQQLPRSSAPQKRHFGINGSSPTVRGTSQTYGTRMLEVLSASPSPRRMHTYGEANREEILVKSAIFPSGPPSKTAFSPTRPTAQKSRADVSDVAMSTIREVQSARAVARHPLILENEAERENTPASRRSQKHFARAKY